MCADVSKPIDILFGNKIKQLNNYVKGAGLKEKTDEVKNGSCFEDSKVKTKDQSALNTFKELFANEDNDENVSQSDMGRLQFACDILSCNDIDLEKLETQILTDFASGQEVVINGRTYKINETNYNDRILDTILSRCDDKYGNKEELENAIKNNYNNFIETYGKSVIEKYLKPMEEKNGSKGVELAEIQQLAKSFGIDIPENAQNEIEWLKDNYPDLFEANGELKIGRGKDGNYFAISNNNEEQGQDALNTINHLAGLYVYSGLKYSDIADALLAYNHDVLSNNNKNQLQGGTKFVMPTVDQIKAYVNYIENNPNAEGLIIASPNNQESIYVNYKDFEKEQEQDQKEKIEDKNQYQNAYVSAYTSDVRNSDEEFLEKNKYEAYAQKSTEELLELAKHGEFKNDTLLARALIMQSCDWDVTRLPNDEFILSILKYNEKAQLKEQE